jgi:hypothetical protein
MAEAGGGETAAAQVAGLRPTDRARRITKTKRLKRR